MNRSESTADFAERGSGATRARLPLTVIGGFLGAGKTTLVERMLRQSQGRRLAVLVNDFGALNIDAELVAASSADTIALTNGCVCCSIGDDLSDALIRVLSSPAPFDAVVIEASGVSDPWRIAQVGLADPGLALDGVVVLVDAAAVLEQAADPLLADSLLRQLRAADLIVVNKVDLVDAARRRQVREWVATVAPGTPAFDAVQAAVPLALVTGAAMPAAPAQRERSGGPAGCCGGHGAEGRTGHDDHPDHAGLFDTWASRPDRLLPAQALREWLRSRPAGVLRLKGLVRTDELGWSEIQFAGRHGSLRRAAAEPRGGAAIVAIGLRGRLPMAALERIFAAPHGC